MQYLGGKSAIASQIAEVIKNREPVRDLLIEPFCGGGAMTAALAPLFERVQSYDVHPDLICLWQALKEGWQPPDTITEAEYKSLRYADPSALRAFAGFGCSFSGMWFGTFARNKKGDNYAKRSKNNLLKDIKSMENVSWNLSDFSKIEVPADSIVYADPPYSGTTDYKTSYSPLKFWFKARQWVAEGVTVYVSEYRAPPDFIAVWEKLSLAT